MKLYTGLGPNPKVVHIFLAEKGMDVSEIQVDLMAGENREASHLSRNPSGQLPTLELDDGSFLAEITAICEYLDEVGPAPTLIGSDPQERAETRMWTRRIDLQITEPLATAFRGSEGHGLFKDRIRTFPQAADDLKLHAQERLKWLDGQIDGKEFICGDRLTLADILLFPFLEFGGAVGQPLDPKLERLHGWYNRMAARPSVGDTQR
ncbi:MAG: glutathione S-transferase family protein [Myxococcales bacterium]|nr:glutathione S-transferase family protein [Myxococcales bacterium]